MQFADRRLDNGLVAIGGIGEIAPGDTDRLMSVLVGLPSNEIHVLILNSPGGSVVAGESLAATVRQQKLAVLVGNDAVCASACFLLFAASAAKFYMPGARVGVHSAIGNGYETPGSMAMTTVMARSAAEMGVPDAVVGRMIRTPPGSIAWLSEAELASMGAKRLEPSSSPPPPSSPQPPAPPVASLPIPAVNASPERRGAVPADPSSPAFQQGLSDRTEWEQWFASLDGDVRQGADYWTGERSKRRPGSCAIGNPGFVQGCLTAKQKLSQPDYRRKAEPQYWWGWNSFGTQPQPMVTSTPRPIETLPSGRDQIPTDAECLQRFGVVCPPYLRR